MIDLTNGLPELGQPKEGITRGGIHTKEYGMWLIDRQAPVPSEKEIYESVPFMHGSYDFSEILGEKVYEDRTLTYVFEIKQREYQRRKINQTVIENWFLKDGISPLYDDHAKGYYYLAKCTGVETEDTESGLRITVDFVGYPFKISILEEGHDIWDEFNFELDYAIPNEYEVNGSKEIDMYNNGANSRAPKVITTAPMTVEKDGVTYNFPAGESKNESFRLKKGANPMTITGDGTIKFLWHKELL